MTSIHLRPYMWVKPDQVNPTVIQAVKCGISSIVTSIALAALAVFAALGTPLFPLLLPITAFLILGSSIYSLVALRTIRIEKPKKEPNIDPLLEEKKFDEAEEILARANASKSKRESLKIQRAEHHLKKGYIQAAINDINDRDFVSDSPREHFYAKMILDDPSICEPAYWNQIINDSIKSERIKRELRESLGKYYFKQNNFDSVLIIFQFSGEKKFEKPFIEKYIRTFFKPEYFEEWIQKYEVYKIEKAKESIDIIHNNWVLFVSEKRFIKDFSDELNKIYINPLIESFCGVLTASQVSDHLKNDEYDEDFKTALLKNLPLLVHCK